MTRTFALAAIAAMACATAAAAQTNNQPVHTEVVAFADLDLRTAEGVRALDRRILSAVQAACGAESAADITGSNDVRRCRKQLLAGLVAQRDGAIAANPRPAVSRF